LKDQFNAGEVVLRLHSHTDNQTVISMTAPQQSLQSGSVTATQSVTAAALDSASFSSLFIEFVDAVAYLYGDVGRSKIEYIVPVNGFAATGGVAKESLHPYVARGISASTPLVTAYDAASLFESVALGRISASVSHTLTPTLGVSSVPIASLSGQSAFADPTLTWSMDSPPPSFTTSTSVAGIGYTLPPGTYYFSSFAYRVSSFSVTVTASRTAAIIPIPSSIEELDQPSFLQWSFAVRLTATGVSFPFTSGSFSSYDSINWSGLGEASGYFDESLQASTSSP
jgi:hypothetical protein